MDKKGYAWIEGEYQSIKKWYGQELGIIFKWNMDFERWEVVEIAPNPWLVGELLKGSDLPIDTLPWEDR